MIPLLLLADGDAEVISLPAVPAVGDAVRLPGRAPLAVFSVDWCPGGIEGTEALVVLHVTS